MRPIFIDIEGSKLPIINPWQPGAFLCSIGMAFPLEEQRETKTWLFRHKTESVPPHADSLKEIQAEIDKADIIVAHNAKFDLNWLKSIGLKTEGKIIWCTMLADYLLSGQYKILNFNLNDVCDRSGFGQKDDKMAEFWKAGFETDEIPLDVHLPYLKRDCELTRDLYYYQYPKIEDNGFSKLAALSFDVLDILSDMELQGLSIDRKVGFEILEDCTTKLEECKRSIFELVGMEFNIGSYEQKSAVIYGGPIKEKYREVYTKVLKSGEVKEYSRNAERIVHIPGLGFTPLEGTECAKQGIYSTDKDTLKLLYAETEQQQIALKLFLTLTNLKKTIETLETKDKTGGLLHKFGIDGRVHPTFKQTSTVTGRLSSEEPNGQNFPRSGTSPVKRVIIPTNDCILNCDLKQIEFRIAAELSRDPTMINEIESGLDVHTDNAVRFFGAGKYSKDSKDFKKLRNNAKTLAFRLLYGGSAMGFFKDGEMPRYTLEKWKKIVDAYWKKYAVLSTFAERNVGKVFENGYLRNPSGRLLRFVPFRKRGMLSYSESAIYNYPIQSGSADLIYLAMSEVRRRMRAAGLKSKLILQVHDAIVVDAFYSEVVLLGKIIQEVYESLPKLARDFWGWDIVVPLGGDIEVGPSYGELYGLDVKNRKPTKFTFKSEADKVTGACESVTINATTYGEAVNSLDYANFMGMFKLAKIIAE